jgi:tRNA (mo5U34)-methyltransferase
VTALDIQDPDATAFSTAKQILGSSVRYIQGSVYDASKLLADEYFDYIFFLGVYYHLKYPLLAFEELSLRLVHGGRLVFEGECWQVYAETIDGRAVKDVNVQKQLREIARMSELPVTLFYPGTFKNDDSNWFIPNATCLRAWLESNHDEVVRATRR